MAHAKAKAKAAENSGGSATLAKVPRGRPFERGKSGNPGGRPPGVAVVQQYAAAHSYEAVDKLVTIMREGEDKEARQAAVAILNRACGMPAQPVAGVPGSPLRVDDGGTVVSLLRKLAGEKPEG